MKSVLSVWFILILGGAYGQSYQVDLNPDSVREDHHSVVREDYMRFEVVSQSMALQKVRMVRTILDKHAKKRQYLTVGYDDLSKILNLSVKVYDAKGLLLRSFKMSDFDDQAAYDRISLLTDNRLKTLSITTQQYPITIESEYETEAHNLMFYPAFYFDSGSEPVEKSQLEVVVPAELGLKYKFVNMTEPKIDSGGTKSDMNGQKPSHPRWKGSPMVPLYGTCSR